MLGFLISSAVVSCERWCRGSLFMLWLLCIPCPSLMTSLVPDLTTMTCTSSPIDDYCQISDLKTLRRALPFSSPTTMTILPSGKIDSSWFWCEYGSCTSPFWPLYVRFMYLKGSKHYYRTAPVMNLSYDHQIPICSLQTSLISAHSDYNDQRLSFDSGESLWFHHGNAGVDRVCWESKLVHAEFVVKLILLFVGVEESSFLMSDSFQGVTLFTPLATTINAQQVLNMLYSLLLCSHLPNYVMDLKMVIPSSEAYVLGVVGLSYIVNAVYGVCSLMPSRIHHPPVYPTATNVHVRLIQSLARSHLLLEDCSPLALIQKANQTSSCRDHERSFPLFLLFVGVNPSTKIPLHERYSFFGSKVNEYCCFPNRLSSCVMVRLGPEDTTRPILMSLEVLEHSTSHRTVTMVYESGFTVNLLPTHLSDVTFSLSIS